MITKFVKYNESIKSLLVGPTKEEAWDGLMNGKLKGFINHKPLSIYDYIYQIMDGCVEMSKDKQNIYYGKNNIILFDQSTVSNLLYVSREYIWIILEKMYGLNYNEIQLLLKQIFKRDKKWDWGGLLPLQW